MKETLETCFVQEAVFSEFFRPLVGMLLYTTHPGAYFSMAPDSLIFAIAKNRTGGLFSEHLPLLDCNIDTT